jgi:hypothetical protein
VSTVSAGYFTAKVTDRGAYSGKLTLAGRAYVLSGGFDSAGRATATIARPGLSPLNVQLQVDLSGGDQIRGRVATGGWSAELLADGSTKS